VTTVSELRQSGTTVAAGITVVVTTVDRPEPLGRCLDAILGGELLPDEIVVIDQGNTGACEHEVAQRSSVGVRLRYQQRPRRGLSAGRNAGAGLASGTIIVVTDDDCVPAPGWLLNLHRALSEPGAPDAVTGPVFPLGPDAPGLYAVSSRGSTVRTEYSARPARPWVVGTGANFAITRAWFERAGGYDERLGAGSAGKAAEDMDMFYRLLAAGGRIRYEPGAVIFHERQPLARRMASRHTYGFGIGAFCGLWLRKLHLHILVVMMSWVLMRMRHLLRAASSKDFLRVREEWVILRATAAGVAAALLRKLDGGPA
jgi:GT2 family glycosyltransferase